MIDSVDSSQTRALHCLDDDDDDVVGCDTTVTTATVLQQQQQQQQVSVITDSTTVTSSSNVYNTLDSHPSVCVLLVGLLVVRRLLREGSNGVDVLYSERYHRTNVCTDTQTDRLTDVRA